MLRKKLSAGLILILIALSQVSCGLVQREHWQAKLWLPHPQTETIVSSTGAQVYCGDIQMLTFFCAKLDDLHDLEWTIEKCLKWRGQGERPPIFDVSRPYWALKIWAPHPQSRSLISSAGIQLKCSSSQMSEFFCAKYSDLKKAEDILEKCQKWR